MAKSSVVALNMLDEGYILTPERYDSLKLDDSKTGVKLKSICNVIKETLTPKKADPNITYLVLDAGDVKDGFIRFKATVGSEEIGSTKKVLKVGDVIISRLRPYLRQVGYVDSGLINSLPEGTKIICSTEFFILRSEKDISFLSPILLTNAPQKILNISQEGGHHPRFNLQTLENISVEENVLASKSDISKKFKKAISSLRAGEQGIHSLLNDLDA